MIGLQTTMLVTWLAAGSTGLTTQGVPVAAQPASDARGSRSIRAPNRRC